MAALGSQGSSSEVAVVVVGSEIKSGREKDFDDWFSRYLQQEKRAPGYLSSTILSPPGTGSDLRYVVTRFKDKNSLDGWAQDPVRIKLIEEAKSYSTAYYRNATGLETWFSLPGVTASPPPPRWKMSIVTFFASYVISVIAITVLGPLTRSLPSLIAYAIITAVLVLALTYAVMPRLAKLLRHWFYPSW
jgi:antibiotic biosynthesis monooxygenase (ABM) superfamily enzyme